MLATLSPLSIFMSGVCVGILVFTGALLLVHKAKGETMPMPEDEGDAR
jgi:hypothetical protein